MHIHILRFHWRYLRIAVLDTIFMPATNLLEVCPLHVGSLRNTPSYFSPVFSLDQQNRQFSGQSKLLSLPPIGSLGGRV
jgi:hypothetical protein